MLSSPKNKPNPRQKVGQIGENMAAIYLTEAGYEIVARNWRCSIGELDIVAKIGHKLVFVEVRTRRGKRFGNALESITKTKQARLIELAQQYLKTEVSAPSSWQIDVIGIQIDRKPPHVTHVENAVGW